MSGTARGRLEMRVVGEDSVTQRSKKMSAEQGTLTRNKRMKKKREKNKSTEKK